MSSITRVLRPKTWVFFCKSLPERFIHSPKVVKEAIMTDIDDLVQEFWRTSSDRDVGASFSAMCHLFEILQQCFNILEVCFDIISVFATAVELADKIYRGQQTPISGSGTFPPIGTLMTESEPNLRYCLMGIERWLISHLLDPNI